MPDNNDQPRKKPEQPPDFQELAREVGEFIRDKFGGNPVITLAAPPTPQPRPAAPDKKKEGFHLDFDYTPKQIKEYLDRYVIRQEEAKKVLGVAVCDHYNHATRDIDQGVDYDYTKQNVLMLGPTGIGKTYLIKCIARLIGVPFVKSDATKYSETGYVGRNVEDMVRELVRKADGDIRLAEYGIIYIDEADKIAGAWNQGGRDVSGAGVQRNLLKLMEETEVPLRDPQDAGAQIEAMMEYQQTGKISSQTINTRNILFIASGAFEELSEVVRRRLTRQALGFGAKAETRRKKHQYLKLALTEDFIAYGLEPEFIGRLPVRVSLDGLEEDDLYEILVRSEGSIVRQYCSAFASFGITAEFADDGLHEIARQSAAENTGARGLVTVCERVLRGFKYELPSTGITSLLIDAALVRDPDKALRKLLEQEKETGGLDELARIFLRDHGIRLSFTAGAAQLAGKMGRERGLTGAEFCRRTLADYPYGLRLAYGEDGTIDFRITVRTLKHPHRVLTGLVKESRKSEKTPDRPRPESRPPA